MTTSAEWRQSFTVIMHGAPTLGVQSFSIHSAVGQVRKEMLEGQPRGSKVMAAFSLIKRGSSPTSVHHLATLHLLNVRNRVIDTALVWGEEPMVPTRQYHANSSTGIQCTRCGSVLFYNVDRSLDYENHICAGCGATACTLTETGASA